MKILGIESSCDETAAAVVEDGYRLLSNVVHSQIDIHSQYGGVIPEVAARSHIEMINPVINKALADAETTWDDIDAIAVTYAPGLVGSLLVGTLAARTLAELHQKPLYPIHHVEAHVYANFIVQQGSSPFASSLPLSSETASLRASVENASAETRAADVSSDKVVSGSSEQSSAGGGDARGSTQNVSSQTKILGADASTGPAGFASLPLPSKQPTFPMLALIVSGGHSQLVLFHDHGKYKLLGETQDDAVGEAFDKVAKIIGLPYPGGPSIAKAALAGDPHAYQLPKAKLQSPYDFSFSGLKTAVLRAVQREVGVDHTFASYELPERLDDVQRANFAASFQHIAVETLVDAAEKAFRHFSPASVVIAGGVAANQELRKQLSARLPIAIEYAPMQLCTDNAAMIATLAYYQQQKVAPTPVDKVTVVPSLSMKNTAWG